MLWCETMPLPGKKGRLCSYGWRKNGRGVWQWCPLPFERVDRSRPSEMLPMLVRCLDLAGGGRNGHGEAVPTCTLWTSTKITKTWSRRIQCNIKQKPQYLVQN